MCCVFRLNAWRIRSHSEGTHLFWASRAALTDKVGDWLVKSELENICYLRVRRLLQGATKVVTTELSHCVWLVCEQVVLCTMH